MSFKSDIHIKLQKYSTNINIKVGLTISLLMSDNFSTEGSCLMRLLVLEKIRISQNLH